MTSKTYRIRYEDRRPVIRIPWEDLPPEMAEQLERAFANSGGDGIIPTEELQDGSLLLDFGDFIKKGCQ